ncbi:hypothetical protein Tco_0277869 [Tanacetum coccineum]
MEQSSRTTYEELCAKKRSRENIALPDSTANEEKGNIYAKEKKHVYRTFTLSTANTPPQSTGNTPTDSDDDTPTGGVFSTNSFDDEDGGVADYNNLDPSIDVPSTPTLRIHKIHPQSQIIGKSTAGVNKKKTSSTESPPSLSKESCVEAMQEEMLQFKLQEVWELLTYQKAKGSMIGCLNVHNCFKTYISFAVLSVCKIFQVTPKVSHLHAVKRILVTMLDNHGQRSTSGCVNNCRRTSFFGNGKKQQLWRSPLQEAENVAAASCCATELWMQINYLIMDLTS